MKRSFSRWLVLLVLSTFFASTSQAQDYCLLGNNDQPVNNMYFKAGAATGQPLDMPWAQLGSGNAGDSLGGGHNILVHVAISNGTPYYQRIDVNKGPSPFGWTAIEGRIGFKNIAVDPYDGLWAVTDDGQMFYRADIENGSWEQVPGEASQIAVGPGLVVHLAKSNGTPYYQYFTPGQKPENWVQIEGRLSCIAVDEAGGLFGANADNIVYYKRSVRPEDKWEDLGSNRAIAVAAGAGMLFHLSPNGTPYSQRVIPGTKPNFQAWVQMDGMLSTSNDQNTIAVAYSKPITRVLSAADNEPLPAEGKIIAIKAPNGKYLQVGPGDLDEGENWLTATFDGDPIDNEAAQFVVLRDGNIIGFKSVATGMNVQTVPQGGGPDWVLRAENTNFEDPAHTWERFQLVNNKFLKSIVHGGYWNLRSDDGRLRTHGDSQPWAPARLDQVDPNNNEADEFEIVDFASEKLLNTTLKEGSIVAIKFNIDDRYFYFGTEGVKKAELENWITAQQVENPKSNANALFEVLKTTNQAGEEVIGFKAVGDTQGRNLQAPQLGQGADWIIRAENQNFADPAHIWEHFKVVNGKYLQSHWGGYINLGWKDHQDHDGKIRTHGFAGEPPYIDWIPEQANENNIDMSFAELTFEKMYDSRADYDAAQEVVVAVEPPVELTEVQAPIDIVKPRLPEDIEVKAPAGFDKEEGDVIRATVGSKDNEIEAWALDVDGKLYRYQAGSMAANPWLEQEVRLLAPAAVALEPDPAAPDQPKLKEEAEDEEAALEKAVQKKEKAKAKEQKKRKGKKKKKMRKGKKKKGKKKANKKKPGKKKKKKAGKKAQGAKKKLKKKGKKLKKKGKRKKKKKRA